MASASLLITLCTPEWQSLCESHRQKRWLTYWSYDALWQENERLKAENEALWQAWSEAEALSEAKQRDLAGSGCAMGLSLSQIVTLLAIVLPRGAVPSRAMVGRWVQAAAA